MAPASNDYLSLWISKEVLLNLRQSKNRPVLDRFQDSSKTGSGINFCAAFLAAFLPPFLLPFLQYKSMLHVFGG